MSTERLWVLPIRVLLVRVHSVSRKLIQQFCKIKIVVIKE